MKTLTNGMEDQNTNLGIINHRLGNQPFFNHFKMGILNRTKLIDHINQYRLDNKLSTYKVRQLEKVGKKPFGVTLNTVYNIWKGEQVSNASVMQLCYKLKIEFIEQGHDIVIV